MRLTPHSNLHYIFALALTMSLVIAVSGCAEESDSAANSIHPSDCETVGSKGTTISVLMLGNSLMTGVQPKVEALLTCEGYTTDFAINNPGGYWLYQHDANTTSNALIANGYDIVLLQEQSGGIGSHTVPYATIASLKTKIEAAGSQMAFYQTWAFSSRNPSTTSFIITRYETIGTYFSAPVFHIGRAWDYYYTSYAESPPFPLFSDSVHATTAGQTLIAYVMYAYLTGLTPVGLSSLTLADGDALILQTIAWDIYNAYG